MSVTIGTNVQKVLRNTRPVFEEGVKRVKKNAEKVDDETLDEWKSAFCQLSREYAILENRIKVSKQVIANQLGVRSSNTENQEKDKDFEKRIKREIDEKISSFDPISDEFCKGVEKKLGKSTVVDNDDIEEVEIEVTESTYKCPYSQLKFDRPMKRLELGLLILLSFNFLDRLLLPPSVYYIICDIIKFSISVIKFLLLELLYFQ